MLRKYLVFVMLGCAATGHAAAGNNRRKVALTPPASTASGLPEHAVAARPLTRRGIVLARLEDRAVADHIATTIQGLGAATLVDVRALTQGRLPEALRDHLRRADAVVLVHSDAGKLKDSLWDDELAAAVRGVSDERVVNVLVGKDATNNFAWPIVADHGGQVSIKGPNDLHPFQRYIAPMLLE